VSRCEFFAGYRRWLQTLDERIAASALQAIDGAGIRTIPADPSRRHDHYVGALGDGRSWGGNRRVENAAPIRTARGHFRSDPGVRSVAALPAGAGGRSR